MENSLSQLKVQKVIAGSGFDSRSNPTVFAGLLVADRAGRTKAYYFTVDSGASTGKNEAVELRDGGTRFGGKGVQNAAMNVRKVLAPLVEGVALCTPQREFDAMLLKADGTRYLSNLGANAVLPVSAAYARARADAMGLTLAHSMQLEAPSVFLNVSPVPFMNVLNAGKHAAQADGAFPGQEIMIGPVGTTSTAQALHVGVETWQMMKKMLKERKLPISIGDEGGFANPFATARESFEFVKEAVERAGYAWGREIVLAVDPAASEYFGKNVHDDDSMAKGRRYHFEKGQMLTPKQMGDFWAGMMKDYPIISMEDIHAQDDFSGWKYTTSALGGKVQLVGDDIFCTNKDLLRMGMKKGIGNSILIKLNQNGTVSGTLDVMAHAMDNGYTCMVSHRSGLGMDDFISHLSVLTGQIKAGSSRERMGIYNSILMLEQMYNLKYAGISAFPPDVQAYWNATWNK